MDTPNISRTPVESSNIATIGYEPLTLKLAVEFKSGQVYYYDNVTSEEFDALMGAESVGRHLNQHIKPTKKCYAETSPEVIG